jgi:hypothetical protein
VDRCALFVDAGYALADGAMAVHGTRRRDSVSWDHAGLLKLLAGLARDRTGLPVLRCYWYETAEGRTAEHDALAEMPGLKLRVVNIRPGQREGIESQVRRDLVTLAKSGAISDAFVASADEHLAEVVSEVQDLGLRVVVLHIASDNGWTIPQPLRQECDDIVAISGVHLRPFVDLIRGAEPALPREHAYQGASGASVVMNGAEPPSATPSHGTASRTGFPAHALPPAATAFHAEAGYGNSANGAGDNPAVAGGAHAMARHGQEGSEPGRAGDGPANVGGRYGYGPDDQGRHREGAANGTFQPGQRHDGAGQGSAAHASGNAKASPAQAGAEQAGGSGQLPVPSNATGAGQPGGSGQLPVPSNATGAGQPGGSGQLPVLSNATGAGQPGGSGQLPVLAPDGPSGGAQGSSPGDAHGQYRQVRGGGAYDGGATPGGLALGGAANGAAVNASGAHGNGAHGAEAGRSAGSSLVNGGPGTVNGGAFSASAAGGHGDVGSGYGRAGDTGRPAQSPYSTGPQQVFDGPAGDQVRGPSVPGGYQTPAVPAVHQNGAADGIPRHDGAPVFGAYPGQQSNGGWPVSSSSNGDQGVPRGRPAVYGGAGAPNGSHSGQVPVLPSAGQPGGGQPGPAVNGHAQYRAAQPGEANGGPAASGQPRPAQPVPGNPPVMRQAPLPGQPQPYYPASPPYPGALVPSREQAMLPVPARGTTHGYSQYPPQQFQPQSQPHVQSQSYTQGQPQPHGQLQQYSPQPSSALPAVRAAQPAAVSLPDAVKAAHSEGFSFGESVSRDAPGLWLEAVLARKPRMPSDLEARLLQGSVLPIDSLLHDQVRHSLRRGFWDALEGARR